ncbi:16984_t:CDS:2 [Gigaspora margarita]|uniref:16984_t:CDS:1 n=1 Tax=Gigaspora margarita TaxID=4874 RepID=A0ABN7UJ58_GIGMA|nr:16984_t:CDS:2 [Gigaspora margarita]
MNEFLDYSQSNAHFTATPPRRITLTAIETDILEQLDPAIFNITTSINKWLSLQLHWSKDYVIQENLKLKKDTDPKVYWVISHLSALFEANVNDGIDRIEFTTQYENISHTVQWITLYGKGYLLSKVNIKDAYRILPVHPVNQVLQSLMFEGQLYFDKALAFGNRASREIFCRFADVVHGRTPNNYI